MKNFRTFLIMLAFVGLSNLGFAQGSGIGYDYLVEEGSDFTLLASDYGSEITIGVPNGGEFELYAPVGSSGQQWTTENCGTPVIDHITTCGPGTYSVMCDQGYVDIEIIWFVELDQPGEDFFEIVGSDTTIVISGNFTNAQWGIVGQSGTVGFSMGPLVPGIQYWVMAFDAGSHLTHDTCTISQASVPVVGNLVGTAVKMYPNPVRDVLFLSGVGDFDLIEVFDVTGKVLYSLNPSETEGGLSFTSFPCGVYFVRLNGQNKNIIRKIVK